MKITVEKSSREEIEIEVKPCPFCGRMPTLKYYPGLYGYGDDSDLAYIKCENCNVRMVEEVSGMSEEKVLRLVAKRWNRRANIDSE